MGPVNGWHRGERAIQRQMGYAEPMSQAWTWIEPEMPEQHQVFYTTRLPFIPVTTLDERRRPWASILAGPDGRPGFATSRGLGELTFDARVWEGDPFAHTVPAARDHPVLIAGIGIEFSTRRRNKFAGHMESFERDGSSFRVRCVVDEAIGNCPKYINVRDLVPFPSARPRVVHRRLELSADERLPEDVTSFVHASDTLFLGTSYEAGEDCERFPSHVGMNSRGGRPGFARVRPSDGRTLVIPDYSGNRLLTSLGNIEATPRAGVTFVSFVTGDVLYLTGDAHNLVGRAAQRLVPRVNALTTVHVTGYILVEDALPVRQKPATQVQRSPYSPPVRLLAEETPSTYFVDDLGGQNPQVTLASIEIHSHDIATFAFQSPGRLDVVPGQAAILDFKSVVGALPYQHMAPDDPASVNDDRIRTWTISGSSLWSSGSGSGSRDDDEGAAGPVSFTLTMRHKPAGVVTSALFALVRKMGEARPELLKDSRPLRLRVPIVGVAGDFTLVPVEGGGGGGGDVGPSSRKLLWVAGGIGVTPFLAMLAGLRTTSGGGGGAGGKKEKEQEKEEKKNGGDEPWDIIFVLSTREPRVLLPLVMRAALRRTEDDDPGGEERRGALTIHVFSRSSATSAAASASASALRSTTEESRTVLAVDVKQHAGRLSTEAFCGLDIKDARERDVYVCGPEDFEQVVLGALKELGVDSHKVRREGFAY